MWLYGDHDIYPLDQSEPRIAPYPGDKRASLMFCWYCKSELHRLGSKSRPSNPATSAEVQICQFCGWWSINTSEHTSTYEAVYSAYRRCRGVLRKLDLNDISIPIAELQKYLIAKYEDRFEIHPRIFEDVVGGVFRDFGYKVRVTAFSGDNGIDIVVMDGDNASLHDY